MAMLLQIKYIEGIGRFDKCTPIPHSSCGRCTLIFGENGWGKSTFADLLRSLTMGNPTILRARQTLAGQRPQKAVLRFDDGPAVFEAGAWTGPAPRIAVYDSVFINGNVFSGDVVSADHLKNQYGLVVGEEGVSRVRRIVALDEENRQINAAIRDAEAQLKGVIRAAGPQGMDVEAFLGLPPQADIDDAVSGKDAELQLAMRARELKAAAEPQLFAVPTETQRWRALLAATIEDVAEDALRAVRAHIGAHACGGEATDGGTHESWLEAGLRYLRTDQCPFCGQRLDDRTLIEAYKTFFSEAYKSLAARIRRARATFARYAAGEFRSTIAAAAAQNERAIAYWAEATNLPPPDSGDPAGSAEEMERTAAQLDVLFQEKQGDLTQAIGAEAEPALSAWEGGRRKIEAINRQLSSYLTDIAGLKESVDAGALPRLENELRRLQAVKRRHEPETVRIAAELEARRARKTAIAEEKAILRDELTNHGRAITATLGTAINAYLRRLNAGFRIDYREPDYRGKEPAASYHILINEVPVAPRSPASAEDKPSFKNTLSAGDKSTLALALFLARINADPMLNDTIVVLDDPFTSLDHFRRQFTAIEIRKLSAAAAQTIVLSHEKTFLRLLWDKIDRGIISSIAFQAGRRALLPSRPMILRPRRSPAM